MKPVAPSPGHYLPARVRTGDLKHPLANWGLSSDGGRPH